MNVARFFSRLTAVVLAGLLLGGCAFYSFTGATLPSHLNTIAIPIAQDNTTSPVTTLDRDLTDRLTDRFVERTRLSLTNNESDADALLEARITQYRNEPTAVTGDERASLNRVTIRVDIRYADQEKDEELLNQSFSNSAEYDPLSDGFSGEQEAARVVIERIADDVFTTATSNW